LAHHGAGQRVWMAFATMASFGVYRHRERVEEPELATLAALRRENRAKSRDTSLPPKLRVVAAGAGLPDPEFAPAAFR